MKIALGWNRRSKRERRRPKQARAAVGSNMPARMAVFASPRIQAAIFFGSPCAPGPCAENRRRPYPPPYALPLRPSLTARRKHGLLSSKSNRGFL
jgi:hypothetical protein